VWFLERGAAAFGADGEDVLDDEARCRFHALPSTLSASASASQESKRESRPATIDRFEEPHRGLANEVRHLDEVRSELGQPILRMEGEGMVGIEM